MKLTMRAKMLGKKVTLISTAFVLAVSTLTAVVPFVASEQAGAVAGASRFVATNGEDTNNDCAVESTPCSSIQYAINKSNPGERISVQPGVYSGDISIAKKVDLRGVNNDAIIKGQVAIKAGGSGSTLYKFTVETVGKDYSVGIFGANDVLISNNTLFNTTSDSVSAKAIYVGDKDASNITITNNYIRSVKSTNKGAYGILINKKNFDNLKITNNHIKSIAGVWVHAIGLEGNTPNATVIGNKISDLSTVAPTQDIFAVFFQDNPSASSVALSSEYNGALIVNSKSKVSVNEAWAALPANITVPTQDGTYRITGQNAFASLTNAIGGVNAGGVVSVESNQTVTAQPTVTKPMTIEGNENTVFSKFSKTSFSNNAGLGIQSGDVTVNKLVVDGSQGTNLHGINVWHAQNVSLNDVTVKNHTYGGGLIVGEDANVTVFNLTTSNNNWYGVNVDKANATLTVNGTSTHNEETHIFSDSRSSVDSGLVKVNDSNLQYVRYWEKDGYRYVLDLDKPKVSLEANALNPATFNVVASDDQGLTTIGYSLWKDGVRIGVWGESIKWAERESFTATKDTYKSLETGTYLSLATLKDGGYTVHATATDARGKTTNAQGVTFSIDHTAPEAKITSPATERVNGTVSIVGTVNDANPMNSYFAVTGPNKYKAESKFTDGRAEHRFDWNTAGLVDGVYKIQFETRDEASNKGSQSIDIIYVTVDNTPPSVTVNTSSVWADDATQMVTGTADQGATVELSVDGKVVGDGVKPDENGNWSFILPSVLTAGTYSLSVRAYDDLGNASKQTQATTAVLTVVNPIVTTPPSETPAQGGDRDTEDGRSSGDSSSRSFMTPTTISPAAQSILGVTDATIPSDTSNGAAEVKGTSTLDNLAQAVDANNTDGKAMGLAWYWWLLIVAGGALVLWWIIAAIRRRGAEA